MGKTNTTTGTDTRTSEYWLCALPRVLHEWCMQRAGMCILVAYAYPPPRLRSWVVWQGGNERFSQPTRNTTGHGRADRQGAGQASKKGRDCPAMYGYSYGVLVRELLGRVVARLGLSS